jgi:hypothetical protein
MRKSSCSVTGRGGTAGGRAGGQASLAGGWRSTARPTILRSTAATAKRPDSAPVSSAVVSSAAAACAAVITASAGALATGT